MTEVFIYDALRTPRGRGDYTGALYETKPIILLTTLLQALRERHQLDITAVNDLLLGCVTPVEDQGFNLARAALLQAGWTMTGGGLQLNRFTASSLDAVNLAAAKVAAGWTGLALAGGIESMSRAPLSSDGGPLRYDPEVIANSYYVPQHIAADLLATMHGIERAELDAYALRSQQRAAAAREAGYFERSLTPVHDRNGLVILDYDECIRTDLDGEQLEALPPAYAASGAQGFDAMSLQRFPELAEVAHRHTAATSSAFADGSALVLLGTAEAGEAQRLRARARIVTSACATTDATLMFTSPPTAARQALRQAGLEIEDIDLWECHESFAAVVLYCQRELGIPDERLNVNGGAIALGDPLGASGAMMLVQLLDELERRDLQRGLLVIGAGAGMAVATIISRD